MKKTALKLTLALVVILLVGCLVISASAEDSDVSAGLLISPNPMASAVTVSVTEMTVGTHENTLVPAVMTTVNPTVTTSPTSPEPPSEPAEQLKRDSVPIIITLIVVIVAIVPIAISIFYKKKNTDK